MAKLKDKMQITTVQPVKKGKYHLPATTMDANGVSKMGVAHDTDTDTTDVDLRIARLAVPVLYFNTGASDTRMMGEFWLADSETREEVPFDQVCKRCIKRAEAPFSVKGKRL